MLRLAQANRPAGGLGPLRPGGSGVWWAASRWRHLLVSLLHWVHSKPLRSLSRWQLWGLHRSLPRELRCAHVRPAARSLRSGRAVPPPFSPNSGTQAPRTPAPSPTASPAPLDRCVHHVLSHLRLPSGRGQAGWQQPTQLTYLRAAEPTPSPLGSQTQQEGDLHSEPESESALEPSEEVLQVRPAACGAVVPSGQGQRLHLGTHGPSPPPTARRRWLPQGGIPESETPQPPPPPRLPGRRAGRSEGGEFGKLVNRKAQPPLLPLPRAAAARSRRQGLRLAAGDHGQVAAKWAAPRKNLEDARGGTSARAPGLSPLSARPRSRLPAPNPEAPRALRLNAEALRARLPPSAALHLLPRATGAPGCCPRTWLNLTFQTVQVSAAEQHSATPSAGSPRPGRGEDLPSTALLAPAFPGRAPWLAASRGALRGRRALGVAGLGKVAKLSGQRFVRNQRGLFLKCPTPSL